MDVRTVAIQGEAGSFSHAAARRLLGEDVKLLHKQSFDALFESVGSGEAERGLLPIENSLAGSIHENYDRLSASPLHIVGETQLRVSHCLIGRPGASLASIRRASSHAVALAQCRRFFAENPQIEPVVVYDTAGSVRDLMQGGMASGAAIGSRLAAELYGGQVLREAIEDDPQNFTRFLLLSRDELPPGDATKTSLTFVLHSVPGSLHRALGAFASRGVDLAKIESRPLRGRPWEYAFYLDAMGDPAGPAGDAVAELKEMAVSLRVLGSYPAAAAREDA
jgi:prephenate dehydratase